MKNKIEIGVVALGGATFAMPDASSMEVMTGAVMFILGIVWLIKEIFNFFSKREADKLNKREQEAEIAKHEAQKAEFDRRLELMNKEHNEK